MIRVHFHEGQMERILVLQSLLNIVMKNKRMKFEKKNHKNGPIHRIDRCHQIEKHYICTFQFIFRQRIKLIDSRKHVDQLYHSPAE